MTDQREPVADEPTGDDPRLTDDRPVSDPGAPDRSPSEPRMDEPGHTVDEPTREMAAADRPEPETEVFRDDRPMGDDYRSGAPAEPETEVLHREHEPDPPTRVMGAGEPAASMGGATLYRDDEDTVTNEPVGTSVTEDEVDPEAERAAARAATRAERNRALGKVSRPAPEPPAATKVAVPAVLRTTDRWHGSLALFVLRLILGGIFFIRGIQSLTALGDTQQFIDQNTVLPYPEILGWVMAIGQLLIAISLIFGFLVRVAGFFALVTAVLALVFVLWGVTNPFQPDVPGFTGEFQLLIAGVGLLFLLLGGGRWGIDGTMRKRRRLKKEAAAGR